MMSARPLPVTATFKPKDYYERYHPGLIYRQCEENLSDVSAGSTESLTSILHHESYSESGDNEDYVLGRETWAKLRCAPEDSRSEASAEPSMPRWPPGGNKAITKEFLAPRDALANGDFLQRNAQTAGAAVYVQQRSRQRRLIAAARPPQGASPPRRPQKKPVARTASPPHEDLPAESKPEASLEVAASGRKNAQLDANSHGGASDREAPVETEESVRVSGSRTTMSESFDQSRDSLTSSADLSPWEKWLLNKERQVRKKQRLEQRREADQRVAAESSRRLKAEKLERERVKVQAWIEKKDELKKKQQRRREAAERAAKAAEAEKKAEIAAKAKVKFDEWYSNKLTREMDAKNKQEEEEQNKMIQKEERLKNAAKAYEKWLQAAQSRPPSSHFSYGFSDGKLTRYYDKSSNPSPSYVNPLPWCHPRTSSRHRKF